MERKIIRSCAYLLYDNVEIISAEEYTNHIRPIKQMHILIYCACRCITRMINRRGYSVKTKIHLYPEV
jgi:hypothetical protein